MDFVYDMTWAEFQIRLFAYKRQDLYDWQKLRELMWITYIAPHQDPKRMTTKKQQFLPLDGDKKTSIGRISDEMRQRFLKEYEKFTQTVKK